MRKKLIYVVGNNVNKSLSPTIFNHWFKKYQINAEYKKIKANSKNFSDIIKKTLKTYIFSISYILLPVYFLIYLKFS